MQNCTLQAQGSNAMFCTWRFPSLQAHNHRNLDFSGGVGEGGECAPKSILKYPMKGESSVCNKAIAETCVPGDGLPIVKVNSLDPCRNWERVLEANEDKQEGPGSVLSAL